MEPLAASNQPTSESGSEKIKLSPNEIQNAATLTSTNGSGAEAAFRRNLKNSGLTFTEDEMARHDAVASLIHHFASKFGTATSRYTEPAKIKKWHAEWERKR